MFLGKSQHYGRVHKPWWFLEQPKKSENYLKQRDFRICGFLRVFACFCGLFAGFLRGFAGFIPSRLMRCKHFLAFVSPNPKTCNQSPKIQDLGVLGKISRYRSNSENTYIFLGFGGSRIIGKRGFKRWDLGVPNFRTNQQKQESTILNEAIACHVGSTIINE